MTDRARGEASGVVGNERLTALTGAVVLVLSVAEIATVPTLGSLMVAHFFVGVLLAGPVVAKTASTGWRFIRYYSRDPAYRRKGPPRPLLRVIAPLLVASTTGAPPLCRSAGNPSGCDAGYAWRPTLRRLRWLGSLPCCFCRQPHHGKGGAVRP
ncbi:hypothetical protein KNN17_00035 [Arthrobacter bambusae]|uniref:hypothetical protein n=1 Tax=Arthrobacter TaxID=1663 RepID=UPI001F5101D3|nr:MULTISPECIES: hypothetical protein [Arthrobacter]MCI0139961.1 hypothetical protein [Arthrobacter bambusae]